MIEPRRRKSKGKTAAPRVNGTASDDESESDDGMPNGVVQEGNDDSSEAEEDEPGVFDIEAEVSGEDDDEDDEEEDSEEEDDSESSASDVSDDESEASSGVAAPKAKTLNRKR